MIHQELNPKIIFKRVFKGKLYFEEWKCVKGYECIYKVSSFGRVMSLKFGKEKILRGGFDSKKYLVVSLNVNGKSKYFRIHQLVAQSFLNHNIDGHKVVVDHIDNVKWNNFFMNLQLITNRLNCSKDKKGKTSIFSGVSWSKSSNKWVVHIRVKGVKKHLGLFKCELKAAKVYQDKLKTIV